MDSNFNNHLTAKNLQEENKIKEEKKIIIMKKFIKELVKE